MTVGFPYQTTYPPNVSNFVPSAVLSKWRVARANVQNGTSNARILFPGDSTVAGYGDSTAATIAATRSMPTRLASLLNTTVTPAAVGLGIPPSTLNLTTDNRWTVGSGWTNAALGAGASAAYSCAAGGGALVYTSSPQVTCDGFYVYYITASSGGTLSCTATGGSAVNTNTAGSSGQGRVLVSAGSAGSSNSVSITSTVTGTCWVTGVEPVLSTKSQILVGNAGVGSARTSNWNSTNPFFGTQFIQTFAPDLTIISMGTNDATDGDSAVSILANFQAMITAAKISGDVILCDPLPQQNAAHLATELTYAAMLQSLAVTNNCAYLGLINRWGGAYNAALQNVDGVHGNDQGYWDWATFIADVIGNP